MLKWIKNEFLNTFSAVVRMSIGPNSPADIASKI